jgi:hypothetical protein
VILSTTAFLWACWANRVAHPDVRLAEWHHLYLGILFAGLAVVSRSPALLVVGALVSADDAWQHVRHVTGAVEYVSPLHELFAHYLWPLEPVRWLTALLDRWLA